MLLVEWIADVDSAVIALHALTSGAGKAFFGVVGGGTGAWVAQQLDHHGLLVRDSVAPARDEASRFGGDR